VFALHVVTWGSIGGAPPPLISDSVLPFGDKGGRVLSSSAKKLSVWLSVTVLGRCGHGVGLLSVGCKLYLCGMVGGVAHGLALAGGVVAVCPAPFVRCPCTTLDLLAPLVARLPVPCCLRRQRSDRAKRKAVLAAGG
jgi:hypothetical protein